MSTYQDEIFNYFTKKDNFFSAYEIYQLFPEIKNTLIEQFWLTVKKSLEVLAKETDWEIEMSDNISETYSKLRIWVDDNFGVCYEKLHDQTYYGLWINFDNKMLDRLKINAYAADLKAINTMNKSQWWLGWSYIAANFNNIETLKRILPGNKDDYAQELANQLFQLAKDLQDDILKMSKMTLK
jgi:hypothetical protein